MSQSDIEQAIHQSRGQSGQPVGNDRDKQSMAAAKKPRLARQTKPSAEQKKAEFALLVALQRFAEQLQDCANEREAVAMLSQCAVVELGCEDCSVYIFNPQFTVLEQWAALGPENPSGRQLLIPIKIAVGEGAIGEVAKSGKSLLLTGAEARRSAPGAAMSSRPSQCSRVLAPIVYQGEVLGVIDSQDHKRCFHDERHLKVLEAMASILALHIKTHTRRQCVETQLSETIADLESASDVLVPVVPANDQARLDAIQSAIDDDALRLFAQPIYTSANGTRSVHAIELFVRCDDGGAKSAPAAQWLPLAKQYGLLGDIDRWVFGAGMQWLGEQHKRLATPVNVNFNIAVSSLFEASFVAFVEQELRADRTAAEHVCFECNGQEINDAVRHRLAPLRAAMERWSAVGCRFILDDAGASSLVGAQYLPFDCIKLDCSHLRSDQHDRASLLSWQYALDMSDALGKGVAIKNVHNAEDYSHVEPLVKDIELIQGEYFDRPMPLTALSESLANRDPSGGDNAGGRGANVLPQ